jgi:carboxymethylenebutenolidase
MARRGIAAPGGFAQNNPRPQPGGAPMFEEANVMFPPQPPLSRRGFIAVTAATAGYTLAAGPVCAQTLVTTDAQGLTVGDVKIPVAGGEMGGYRAKPASGSAFPVVLVCQEIFGIHEYIKDTCRRLAKAGYLAVAPDYYFRQGDPSKAPDMAGARAIADKKPDAELMGDLDATQRWATATDGGNPQKVAITGFCRGGRTTWMYAAHSATLKAGVAWYGPVAGQGNDLTPKFPIDLAAAMKAPVLGLYGAADAGIPVETVQRMEAALKAAGKTAEFVIYPDAPHGFHADYRPTYRAELAKDGWNRMLGWFKKHGVA